MEKLSTLLFLLVWSSQTFQVLHVTDIHLDPLYLPGSEADCSWGKETGLGCCRKKSDNPKRAASIWGDVDCDTPLYLIEKSFEWLNDSKIHPDIVLWTGDVPGHHDLNQSKRQNLDGLEKVNGFFAKYYGGTVPVIFAIGNHDTYPIDQFPASSGNQWLLKPLFSSIESFLPWDEEMRTSFQKFGYFSYRPQEGWRIIVINNLYWDKMNLELDITDLWASDPAGQWTWLKSELESSRLGNETVWIVGHIFPGSSEGASGFGSRYESLVAPYANIVAAQFWGHTHRSEITLVRNEGSVWGVNYVASSLQPDKVLPGFRVYEIDEKTLAVSDFSNWGANLTATEESGKLEFFPVVESAREFFGLPDLAPESWSSLFWGMLNDTSGTFQKYMMQYYNGLPHSDCSVGSACHRKRLCRMLFASKHAQDKCADVGPGGMRQLWLGTAPFCETKAEDCVELGMKFVRHDEKGDGKTCETGTKTLCTVN